MSLSKVLCDLVYIRDTRGRTSLLPNEAKDLLADRQGGDEAREWGSEWTGKIGD